MSTTTSAELLAADLLAPVTTTLRTMFPGTPYGLAPGLLVPDLTGWFPATLLIDGDRLADLLALAQCRWQAAPHVAATLAWKSYCYWSALPAVLGWATARRVPLLPAGDVLLRLDDHDMVTVGLRSSVTVAVLPSDPLANTGLPPVRVVDGTAEMLAELRKTLLDAHLAPVLAAIQAQARVSTRQLLGSLSAGIAHGVLRAAHVLPGSATKEIGTLLNSLGIPDLIELVPGRNGVFSVRRKTCCLAFTLPRPTICPGCCITS